MLKKILILRTGQKVSITKGGGDPPLPGDVPVADGSPLVWDALIGTPKLCKK